MSIPETNISWRVTRGDAVVSGELTQYVATTIDPTRHMATERVSRFQWRQRPILWSERESNAVVVDIDFSSTLTLCNVPRMVKGETATIGTLTKGACEMPPREILQLLSYANVLRVYWHLEGTLRLERETTEGGAYQANLTGQHIYFTSKKHNPTFAFAFEITKKRELVVTCG